MVFGHHWNSSAAARVKHISTSLMHLKSIYSIIHLACQCVCVCALHTPTHARTHTPTVDIVDCVMPMPPRPQLKSTYNSSNNLVISIWFVSFRFESPCHISGKNIDGNQTIIFVMLLPRMPFSFAVGAVSTAKIVCTPSNRAEKPLTSFRMNECQQQNPLKNIRMNKRKVYFNRL